MADSPLGFVQPTNNLVSYSSFDGMGFHDNLLRGIYAYGLEKPSEIQQRAIVPMLQSGDFVIHSPAGTGKTLSHCVAILQRLNFADPMPQAMVVVPTRELAIGTSHVLQGLGEFLGHGSAFCQVLCPTGVAAGLAAAASAPLVAQILVGTPNRFAEYCAKQRNIPLSSLSMIVLDEADELVSRGHYDPLCDFFSAVPRDQVSVLILTATMPTELVQATKQFTRTPTYIQGKRDPRSLEGILHFYVMVEEEYKLETLLDIFSESDPTPCVVYVNTKRKAEWLAERLPFSKVLPPELLPKSHERRAIIQEFHDAHFRRLIAVRQSLKCDEVGDPFVVNYDFPSSPTEYFERIGRGGGAWRNRTLTINFVTQLNRACVRETERYHSLTLEELPTDFVLLLP